MLKRYSLLYLPVSCDNCVRRDACGADLESGGPLVEQTASVRCIVGEMRRRKRAFRVVGGGRCSVACRRVGLLANDGWTFWGLSRIESKFQSSIGALGGATWRYPGDSLRRGIKALRLGVLVKGTVL